MLTDKEVCGGGFSEKLCYDFGEELFGFDSANINMVWSYTTLRVGTLESGEMHVHGPSDNKHSIIGIWENVNKKKEHYWLSC